MTSNEYSGLTLAYIGDGYYELIVRNLLVKKGLTKVNDLHKMAIKYTSGEAQKGFIEYFLANNMLTEEEINIFKRGRNIHTSQNRKNISLADYQKATGFEALIGYLYLEKKLARIDELLDVIDNIVSVVIG